MEGKGWFVIYGLLVFFAFYLFLAQQQQNGKIKDLRQEVASLKQQLTTPTPPAAESGESASPEATPDLSTPQARDKQRKSDLAATAGALNEYQRDNGSFPTERKILVSKYLKTLPEDPLSPKYSYRYRKTDSGFVLTCVLETKNDPDDVKGTDTKRDQVYTVTEKST